MITVTTYHNQAKDLECLDTATDRDTGQMLLVDSTVTLAEVLKRGDVYFDEDSATYVLRDGLAVDYIPATLVNQAEDLD